jgi:hypothetical protein
MNKYYIEWYNNMHSTSRHVTSPHTTISKKCIIETKTSAATVPFSQQQSKRKTEDTI